MVTEDSKVLEEGEVVDDDLANVLTELGIEPKEVGLDLKGVYSEGVLFEPDELEIDVDEYEADIRSAAAAARNLSVNAAYPTAATAGTLREGVRRGQVRRTVRGDREPGRRARPHREGRRPAPLARGPDRRRGGASRGAAGRRSCPAPETDDADEEEEQAEEEDDTDDAEAADDDADDGDDGGDGLGAMFG